MPVEVNENTKLTLDLKTIGIVVGGAVSLATMYFTLQAEIAEAKTLPAFEPEITRVEFDMKDQLIRQTILTTQDDVAEIKQDLRRIEEKLDNLQ
jgi:hypothetical protein